MKVVIDSAIPYIKGVLEPFCEVRYVGGPSASQADVRDADALIIRTRTRCNAALLDGSSVRVIATATIGTDHIDMEYCRRRRIAVFSAPGCDSSAVCQWVYSALLALSRMKCVNLSGLTLGVVGVGHVGSKVAEMAARYGLNVLLNDPPRESLEGGSSFVSLDYLLSHSDIVTLHVPLDENTANMASDRFFDRMKRGAIFLNASRGDVVDENALLQYIGKFSAVALDVWRNEPDIDRNLLNAVDIATMHIAGYSVQGKINGTNMALAAVCEVLGLPVLKSTMGSGSQGDSVAEIIPEDYDIMADDAALRAAPELFERLRSEYEFRG